MSAQPPPPQKPTPKEPISQAYDRARLPDWMQQLPFYRVPEEPDPNFQLIDRTRLQELLQNLGMGDSEFLEIENDLRFLDYELLRLFRQRDHQARRQLKRQRSFQIMFMILAAIASIIGALQALSLSSNPNQTPLFAFLETLVALFTAYLATTSKAEPSSTLWTTNRGRAEHLRREYFRYLVNLSPYDNVEGVLKRQLLASRAAAINRGIQPGE